MTTVEHCICCFEHLSAYLDDGDWDPLELAKIESSWAKYLQVITDEKLETKLPAHLQISQKSPIQKSPLFVTWNTISPDDPTNLSLRGCIGTFESVALAPSLPLYAITSATRDPRFEPISRIELPKLSVSVTLLTDFEACDEPLGWEVGVHGIRVKFTEKGEKYEACYLPDIAVESGWNTEQCVISCMQKSGWRGNKHEWRKVGDLKVTRFQGSKKSITHEEYNEWSNWDSSQRD
ncbi:hypothetical protein K3495_g3562 [Podosphaera aphanis]|nr:hypothetical protein K3495_g3562 [Podosphaera aphanis]